MPHYLQTLTLTYLLYPVLGLLLIFVGLVIAKKNDLLGNRRLVGYALGATLVLTLPALLGFLDYDFMPVGYIGLGVLYLALGRYHVRLTAWAFKGEQKYRHEIILTLLVTLVSMLFFTPVFNLCNELQYGWLACTCLLPFVLASVFTQGYTLYMAIPSPIYKIWRYDDSPAGAEDAQLDYNHLSVITLELFKREEDAVATRVNAKAAGDMPFGVWFRRLITDYNVKFPAAPIDNYAHEADGGWIFYYKPSFFQARRYIDHELSFKGNRIKRRRYTIFAKRVKENK
jgi:hypothetical protein